MAFIVLVVLPGTVWIHSLLNQQTLMGNYPMRIRWQVHRYLLKQSMTFYQDEFAGRIATKLMQTALAVRECVIKLIDVLNYVIVYFLGMLVIVGSADWRLAVPLAVWLVLLHRAAALLHPAARQGGRGAGRRALDDDRPRRRQLHQHPDGEAVFACAPRGLIRQGGHGELSRDGLPLDAARHHAVRRALRAQFAAAVFGDRDVDLAVARQGCDDRRGCRGHRPRAEAVGHVAMDHVGSVGPVREYRHGAGRHHLDLDAQAGRGQAWRQGHRRPARRDRLRAHRLPLRQGQGRHREPVADRASRARRSAWSAARAPASRRWSTCCCASTTSKAAAS